MSQVGTYLAAGAALAGVSEATGTTAFTPLGQQARDGQQGGGGRGGGPAINLPEQADANALEALATAFQNQQGGGGGTSIDLDLGQQGAAGGAALEELRTRLEEQQEKMNEWREEQEERVNNRDVDGDGQSDVPEVTLPDWMKPDQGDDSESDDSSSDEPREWESASDVLLNPGTWGREQIGGPVKDTGGELGETATEGGQTIWEAGKLLWDGRADTSDTWAEDRGEVSIGGGVNDVDDWAAGKWNDLKNSAPSLPSGDSSSDEEAEVFGLGGGVDAINPTGNTFREDSSSDSSTRSRDEEEEEEPVISLPDSVKRKTDAAVKKIESGNTHQIGGL